MLNEVIARSFIEQLADCTDYNISIISKTGFVLACSGSGSTGKYHDIASKMIQENIPIVEVREGNEYLGIKPGINLLFHYNGEPSGVIFISGDAEKIRRESSIIRKSVELMMVCEFGNHSVRHHKNARDQFLNYLLYSDIEPENMVAFHELFDTLNYQKELPRIPVLLSVKSQFQSEQILRKAKELLPLSVQDILTLNRNGQIILFLSYAETLDGFFENYRFYISSYLKKFVSWCHTRSLELSAYIGPIQINPANYKYGYEKALWLRENIRNRNNKIVYFYEHIGEYLRTQLPFIELHRIFEIFSAAYPVQFSEQLVNHMDVLYENNYNFKQSSDQMFIHKNTLAFRLDKIRERLGADPIQNLKDRELVEYFCYYLHQTSLLPHP